MDPDDAAFLPAASDLTSNDPNSSVWGSEPPADITPHVVAFFAATALSEEVATVALEAICALFHQAKLSRAAAAAAAVVAAVIARRATPCARSATVVADAMRALHAQQGMDAPPMVRVLLWGLRSSATESSGAGGASAAADAVDAVSAVVTALPLLSITEAGPIQAGLHTWMLAPVPLQQAALERAPLPCFSQCNELSW